MPFQHLEERIAEVIETFRYSSRCPWREAYIRSLFNQAKDLLRKGEEGAAGILFNRLETVLEEWIPKGEQWIPRGEQGVPRGEQGVPRGEQGVPRGEQGVPEGDGHPGFRPRFEFSDKDAKLAERIRKFLSGRQPICSGSGTSEENHGFNSLIEGIRSLSNSPKPGESQATWDLYRRWSIEEAGVWDKACFRLWRRLRFFQGLDLDTCVEGAWGPYNQRYNLLQTLRHLFSFHPEWLESYLLLYDSLQSFEKAIAVLPGKDTKVHLLLKDIMRTFQG